MGKRKTITCNRQQEPPPINDQLVLCLRAIYDCEGSAAFDHAATSVPLSITGVTGHLIGWDRLDEIMHMLTVVHNQFAEQYRTLRPLSGGHP